MGKGTDKLYITHSEWSSSVAYGAAVGSNASSRSQLDNASGARFKRLPFNFCAASLQPFKNPVCTPDGTIFDAEVIHAWLKKRGPTNPVNGEPLAAKDLIKLNFTRNADVGENAGRSRNAGRMDGKGDMIDPVSFKVLTDNTHIVAIRHGDSANVFAWDTIERMNIKAKMWRDLVDDVEFGRRDIITLQDPHNAVTRDLSQFKHLQDGEETQLTREQQEKRESGTVNIAALGRMGDKVLLAKEAVERARKEREAGGDVNLSAKGAGLVRTATSNTARPNMIAEKKVAANASISTTGRAAASFTSTGLTPDTSGARALLSEEEWMLKPKRVQIKGFARIETNLGDLNIQLHTDTAPKAVWNFVRLAQKGYYKGVTFHRNIRNFMIQGGDPTGTGRGGTSIWGKNFVDEFEGPLKHSGRGVISMANKGKNTNSSQFFITYRPAKHLDRKHTIFGQVMKGMEVLDRMEATPTDEGTNRPINQIAIKDVVVFLDPFEEFQKEKRQREREEAKEEVRRHGGTGDDRTTWTGKRIRDNGTVAAGSGAADDIGKYLKAAQESGKQEQKAEPVSLNDGAFDIWDAPSRKKMKTSGFGNFDSW